MGKDSESLLPQRQIGGQFFNVNSLTLPSDSGMRTTGIPCAIPCTDAAPANGVLPAVGFSGLPNIKSGQQKEPPGWFYCLPRFRQGFIPDLALNDKFLLKTDLPVKVPTPAKENLKEANPPAFGTGYGAKQFLVFDQTGSKMTMMFSSGIGTTIPRPNAWSRKPDGLFNVNEKELRIGSDAHYFSGPNVTDDLDYDYGFDEASEMHEDTEEIDALLFSDDEDNDSDDGEETSTGHSPSSMTAYEKQDLFDDEDSASSAGPVKKQKLSDSGYQVTSVTYAGNSVKPNRSSDYEDDAESSCAGCKPMRCTNLGSLPGNKRLRKEKIRETVSILQTILPGGKGKDAVIVLDEAINYLRTLKFKAKSLGPYLEAPSNHNQPHCHENR